MRARRAKTEEGYTPSFTARALGIEPIEVTMAQAEKLISRVQTGFELRAPVIVKTGISKKLMAKIEGKKMKGKVKKFTMPKEPTFKVTTFKEPTFKMPTFKMPKVKGFGGF